MSADTIIQWCNATVNFWWGCTKVSPGCEHCYAEALARRLSRGRATWGPSGARWLRVDAATTELLKLAERAVRRGRRLRVFVNSMADTFEDRRDLDSARHVLWAVAPVVSSLDLLLLTKRPENVSRLVPAEWLAGKWPANVWLGTTVEDQQAANTRIPRLLALPAPVRWLSCEPLLGAIDLAHACFNGADSFGTMSGIDWAIIGGESGAGARNFDVEAGWDMVRQCQRAGVATFVKQLGARPVTGNANVLDWPDDTVFIGHGEGVASARVKLHASHGGDPNEWPAELRVRQFPDSKA